MSLSNGRLVKKQKVMVVFEEETPETFSIHMHFDPPWSGGELTPTMLAAFHAIGRSLDDDPDEEFDPYE